MKPRTACSIILLLASLLVWSGCSDNAPPANPGDDIPDNGIRGDTAWVKFIERDLSMICYDAILTRDNNLLISGHLPNEGGGFLLMTDEYGDEIWFHQVTVPVRKVIPVGDGYTATGYENNTGTIYLGHYGPTGDERWVRSFEANSANWLLRDSSGNYFIVGAANVGMMMLKTSSEGEELWQKTYGDYAGDEGKCLVEAHEGGLILTGRLRRHASSTGDPVVMKTDYAGRVQWQVSHRLGFSGSGNHILRTGTAGYLVAGYVNAGDSNGGIQGRLLRVGNDGEEAWSMVSGAQGWDEFVQVAELPALGYVAVGYTEAGVSDNNTYMAHSDYTGALSWHYQYGIDGIADEATAVLITDDGGVLIVGRGWVDEDDTRQDIYLVKTYSNGRLTLPDDGSEDG